jgi:hypothetical protein
MHGCLLYLSRVCIEVLEILLLVGVLSQFIGMMHHLFRAIAIHYDLVASTVVG